MNALYVSYAKKKQSIVVYPRIFSHALPPPLLAGQKGGPPDECIVCIVCMCMYDESRCKHLRSVLIFPLVGPQKKPPTSPKIFRKIKGENTVFWGLVGGFFGKPTQVEIYQRSVYGMCHWMDAVMVSSHKKRGCREGVPQDLYTGMPRGCPARFIQYTVYPKHPPPRLGYPTRGPEIFESRRSPQSDSLKLEEHGDT